jgi:S-adenosylmethionine/arginine decarboxylase-like enzyme
MKGNFGTSLILDFEITDMTKLNNKEILGEWLLDLVKDLNMSLHHIDNRPAIMIDTWEPPNMPHAGGTSAILLITSSSISFHSAVDQHDKTKGVGYLDIYSCGDFTMDQVHKNIDKHFDKPLLKRWQMIDR